MKKMILAGALTLQVLPALPRLFLKQSRCRSRTKLYKILFFANWR